LVFSACEDVTNSNGGIAGISELTALSVSSAKVGQPTPIDSVSTLMLIGNSPAYPADGDYILTNDLYLPNWSPICNPAIGLDPFTGTFDGDNHTITITQFNTSVAGSNLGIFAETAQNATTYSPASFSNLTVNMAVPAGSLSTSIPNIGGLVGNASNTQFNRITVTGAFDADLTSMTSNAPNLGGVAGIAQSVQFNNVNVQAGFNVNYHGPGTGSVTLNVGGIAGYAQTSQFTSDTISSSFTLLATNGLGSLNVNEGGVAGLGQSSTFSNVNVRGTFGGTLSSPAPTQKGELVLIEDAYVFHGLTATGSDGLNLGGVAGDGSSSQFSAVVSSAIITALSPSAPVYVGGVVGYAKGANIDTSQANGSVTGDGFGYNTSAGGIAGYVINSRIRDSFAVVPVNLRAEGRLFNYTDTWQIYAGGLAGYVGGSDEGPSLVDHSYATGNVTAYSPFPYAGGLVGYLYGYNDFTNPAKNGSTVKRSYAASSVTATAQPDPNDHYSGMPYAGGLVGYSSVVDSTIEDSYARGIVLATTDGTYAWAGGIVGGNANNAVVINTYATGNVTSDTGETLAPEYPPQYAIAGPAVGGIAGFNYYTSNTKVRESVALNRLVNGDQITTQDVVHRVVGSLNDGAGYEGILINNLANGSMTVTVNWKPDPGADRKDGASVASVPDQSVYADLGWDFSKVWTIGADGYPDLR
jgi:hypothetical protein